MRPVTQCPPGEARAEDLKVPYAPPRRPIPGYECTGGESVET